MSSRRSRFQHKTNDLLAGDDVLAEEEAVAVNNGVARDQETKTCVDAVGGNKIASRAEPVVRDNPLAGENSVGDRVFVCHAATRIIPYSNTGVGQERGEGIRPCF